jgi:fructosamine-3-kinase
MIPKTLQEHLSQNHDITIEDTASISGGCINQAFRLSTNRGELFLKYNPNPPSRFFECEVEGLEELRKARSEVRIPETIASESASETHPSFLLMEYIPPYNDGNAEAFGAALAQLHKTRRPRFGFAKDNYIGSLPQANPDTSNWPTFFVSHRIEPLLKMAIDSGKLDGRLRSSWERLSVQISNLIPSTEPSLLHGDLWSGNFFFDSSGKGVLVDPAVYYGHPEMDLAFSRMFGGFGPEFYDGYASISPLEPGFEDRIDVHNLYPLLVHVNLFGGHYIRQVESVLGRW